MEISKINPVMLKMTLETGELVEHLQLEEHHQPVSYHLRFRISSILRALCPSLPSYSLCLIVPPSPATLSLSLPPTSLPLPTPIFYPGLDCRSVC